MDVGVGVTVGVGVGMAGGSRIGAAVGVARGAVEAVGGADVGRKGINWTAGGGEAVGIAVGVGSTSARLAAARSAAVGRGVSVGSTVGGYVGVRVGDCVGSSAGSTAPGSGSSDSPHPAAKTATVRYARRPTAARARLGIEPRGEVDANRVIFRMERLHLGVGAHSFEHTFSYYPTMRASAWTPGSSVMRRTRGGNFPSDSGTLEL